ERTKENLRATVLVEKDRPWRELLRLGREEVEDHGLAGSRRADDGEVTEIAVMEVEEVGRRARCFEHADRLAPMIAARAAHGEPVERDETGRIGAGDQRPTNDILFIARELAPESGLKVHVLTDRDG